jgi:hypothetical protein
MLCNEEKGGQQHVNIRVVVPHLSYINLKLWLNFGFCTMNFSCKSEYKTHVFEKVSLDKIPPFFCCNVCV